MHISILINNNWTNVCLQPARQEVCNTRRCSESVSTVLSNESKKATGMSGWLVALIVLLGLAAAGGIGFAGYAYYQR